jgi:hypothetical protein
MILNFLDLSRIMFMENAIRSMLLDGVYGVVVSCHGKRDALRGNSRNSRKG